jgi:ribonuclease HII
LSKRKLPNNLGERFFYEERAKKSGYSIVAGIDEAGRGPLAGPVVAGAVIVRDTEFVERIDDSKKLTAKMRQRAFLEIMNRCDVGIGVTSSEDIDRLNILNATLLAMKRAIEDLGKTPEYLLIDGKMDIHVPQKRTYLISGESKSISIAAASIIAKVFRDKLMEDEDRKYPQYGFKKHKGYGTKFHMESIKKHGLCPIHRESFGPFGRRSKAKQKEKS